MEVLSFIYFNHIRYRKKKLKRRLRGRKSCGQEDIRYEEAIKNAQIVIYEWIDTAQSVGREIPRPRGRLAYA